MARAFYEFLLQDGWKGITIQDIPDTAERRRLMELSAPAEPCAPVLDVVDRFLSYWCLEQKQQQRSSWAPGASVPSCQLYESFGTYCDMVGGAEKHSASGFGKLMDRFSGTRKGEVKDLCHETGVSHSEEGTGGGGKSRRICASRLLDYLKKEGKYDQKAEQLLAGAAADGVSTQTSEDPRPSEDFNLEE